MLTSTQDRSTASKLETPQSLHESVTASTLNTVIITTDSTSSDDVQLNYSKGSKHTSGIINILLSLPVSLAAVSTSEHNWRLIERVRQEGSPDTELVAPQSVPFKLNNKLAAAHFLTEMLNEIPSQCGQAQYALVGTLCGTMTLFMLVTSVGFQVFMLFMAITCVAMPYILREVQNLARSLIRLGVPRHWSYDDDKLVAMLLALPNATILLPTLLGGTAVVYTALFCGSNIPWPSDIIGLFRGGRPQTSQNTTMSASAPKSSQWLYWSAGCYLILEFIRCAVVHHRLSKCLRRGYDNDGENLPQSVLLQAPDPNSVNGPSDQTPETLPQIHPSADLLNMKVGMRHRTGNSLTPRRQCDGDNNH